MSIARGAEVEVRNALDEKLRLIATSAVVHGTDFEVVWVCERDEWRDSRAEGREPRSVPWPAEDVSLAAAP